MHDPALLIGYLAAVSLTADFLPRRDAGYALAAGRLGEWGRWLALRSILAAILMLPAWVAFGQPGLVALFLVVVPRIVMSTVARLAPDLGTRPVPVWRPLPAAWVLADQAVVLGSVALASFVLRDAVYVGPQTASLDDIARWTGVAAVAWALLVANTRAACFIVELLLPPESNDPQPATPTPTGYNVRLGPLSGRIEADLPPVYHALDSVGATIGDIERLLTTVLILARAEVAIGLVIAAKTLARFKRLDERHFAERYLIGTLASITIAVASALAARLVLGI